MYLIVVGAGKVGVNLTRELMAQGHEVTLTVGQVGGTSVGEARDVDQLQDLVHRGVLAPLSPESIGHGLPPGDGAGAVDARRSDATPSQ